ncbi:F0F1 ATP synthase subunit A [Paenibacillus taiwanensis]|uniref:F0F1 ATP synthase subunit A n=1 Tax=Paenibacillus taiwanensis TaxID=401638 RepID=UPI00042A1DA7|nr:F0F1 ATP synthase subunit A [Paenibacillus taiwanensis]
MHESPIINLGGFHLDLSVVLMLFVSSLIVFVLAIVATRNLSVENPGKLQNFMEWVVEFVQGLISSTMDWKKGKAFVSLGMTLILFIFVSNLLGLPFSVVTEHHHADAKVFGQVIEATSTAHFSQLEAEGKEAHAELLWWKSPTADASVTMGLAIIIFILCHYLGLVKNTKGYFKHYVQPYVIFLPINLIETLAKPLTHGMRLYANIYAGEVLITVLLGAGFWGIPGLVAWQGFSIFIGAIQAFVFTILTMVYIGQMIETHDEH